MATSGDLPAEIDTLLGEMIAQQESRLRRLGRRIVPEVTLDDLLAPDDVPALAADRDFMYEDGVLAGLLAARTAIRAQFGRADGGRIRGDGEAEAEGAEGG